METPAAAWPERDLRPKTRREVAAPPSTVVTVGAVSVLEGDAATVSGIDGALGIRFDDARNDLAAVTARYAREVGDGPGILVLFTTFPDHGAGGPAYFVPLFNADEGTGLGPVDQRATFGVAALEGVIDMKELALHPPERFDLDLAHEVAHRHLAYMRATTTATTATGTATVGWSLTGRQAAHWHAALHADASLLGGYAWRETTRGHFVVEAREQRFSDLDLYGLGLLAADEVGATFFIDGLRTTDGFALPAAAELQPGARALGTRVELGVDDVVRALGPRSPSAGAAPTTTRLRFLVLTAPGEAATSTRAQAIAAEVDARRAGFEAAWRALTRGRGAVETAPSVADADGGCACETSGGAGPGAPTLLLLFATAARAKGTGRAAAQGLTDAAGGSGHAARWRRRSRSRRRSRRTEHAPRPTPHAPRPTPSPGAGPKTTTSRCRGPTAARCG